MCESQVSSSLGTEMHYQLMCKRLFEEASELLSLAAEVFQHYCVLDLLVLAIFLWLGK